MKLIDRLTLGIVEVYIDNAILGVRASTGDAEDEPTIPDLADCKYYTLFVSDSELGIEEVETIPTSDVELRDETTSIIYKVYSNDGEIGLIEVVGIDSADESNVTTINSDDSKFNQTESLESRL